jgi:hypothetical protein
MFCSRRGASSANSSWAFGPGPASHPRPCEPSDVDKVLAALAKPPAEKRFRLAVAEAEADALTNALRQGIGKGDVVVAGSYRRRRDTVGDLDVLVTGRDGAKIGDKLAAYKNVAEVTAHGSTWTAVILRSGLQVDLRVVPPESYGAALLYFTGSTRGAFDDAVPAMVASIRHIPVLVVQPSGYRSQNGEVPAN